MSAPSAPALDLDALEQAVDWASGSAGFDNAAYVNRLSGQIVWVGEGIEEEEPDDLGSGAVYLAVPDQRELGLGKSLALDFAVEYLGSRADEARDLFRRKGAYRLFKQLVERHGLLDSWHAYRDSATQRALEQWAKDNGFSPVTRVGRRAGDA